jgi:hypothetical protein
MTRFLPLLAIACGCIGCAGVTPRERTSAEIRTLATAQIRQCCLSGTSDENLAIEKTPEGWSVNAPSKCPDAVAPTRPAGTSTSMEEIEETTVLCAGGGASLFYDKDGKLLELIKWQ